MSNIRSRVARIQASEGFIVVAVLWILAALATLSTVYAIFVANTVSAARANDDRIQAQALTSAAVELTAYRLSAGAQGTRPSQGTFSFRMGGANVTVEFRSESARIDLNLASKELLAGLFTAIGARPGDSEFYAERIIGWRTSSRSTDQSESKEASLYKSAGLNYLPRGGPFANAGELWLVMGIPPQIVERAFPYVTVFNGRPNIDILAAAPLALAAVPGMTPELLATVLNQRGVGRQGAEYLFGLLGPAQAGATIEESRTNRIRIQVEFQNRRVVNATVVILLLEDAAEPFRVLSWRDDVDGPITDEPPGTGLR